MGQWFRDCKKIILSNEMLLFKKKDLDKYFQNMLGKFCQLGGIRNPDLKQAFVTSILEILSIKMFSIL